MTAPKNLAASVKARIQNVATQRGESFNLLLTRYGIERLLYRLSQSSHAERFLLKGAMLFVLWDDHTHRPTRDLDLLGFVAAEKSELTQTFREVIGTTVPEDGLIFDSSSVQADEIREPATYGGIRIRLLARLGSAEIPVQIDIGAGDAVTLEPESVMFPVLLDFPAPKVRVYPAYTVVAEKFEAMVSLGATNTRMKDFYDLWFLSTRFEFDPTLLRTAIQATFTRRQTRLTPTPEPFSESFATDPTKQVQWTAFLRRNDLRGASPKFPEVMTHIRNFIEPVLRSAFPE
jgi:hypothetical protein